MIGAMDLDYRAENLFWQSKAYFQDDVTWCVSRSKARGIWRNIFQIFSTKVWFALIVATLVIAVAIRLITQVESRRENFVWSFMFSVSAAIGRNALFEPKRTSVRILMVFLFLYGLVLSTSFSTFLVSALTKPHYKYQVSNIEQAVERNFKFVGGEVVLSYFQGDDEVADG